MIHWSDLSTAQRIDAVKGVWQPGFSAKQIAEALPYTVSRNAIIGMVYRHLKGEIYLRPPGDNGDRGRRADKPARVVRARRRSRPFKSTEFSIPPNEYDASALAVPLQDLSAKQCEWPVNDVPHGGVFLFCGHEVDEGARYCAHHRLRSVQPFSKALKESGE